MNDMYYNSPLAPRETNEGNRAHWDPGINNSFLLFYFLSLETKYEFRQIIRDRCYAERGTEKWKMGRKQEMDNGLPDMARVYG